MVFTCGNDKPKKPVNLISKDKMSEVLYDLYIINAAKGVNRKLLETNGVIPENFVLTKHKIDSVQFAESNMYYAFDTKSYSAIVTQVKTRLEKEKKEFEALEKKESLDAKRLRDSLNKIKARHKDSIFKLNKKDVISVLDSLVMN
jgi:hypothetical protein